MWFHKILMTFLEIGYHIMYFLLVYKNKVVEMSKRNGRFFVN